MRSRMHLLLVVIPVIDLFAIHMHHAGVAVDMGVDLFEIFDAVRLARDIRMDRHGHDARTLRALLPEPIKLIAAAALPVFGLMVLH